MARHRVYNFGQFRLVPRDRILFSASGSKARITGKPLDLLLYLLDHAETEIDTDFLCTGQFSDGVALTSEALNKHFGKLYSLIDPDRDKPTYIRRDDRSTWFLKRTQIVEENDPDSWMARPLNNSVLDRTNGRLLI
jgi:hypothetical protein